MHASLLVSSPDSCIMSKSRLSAKEVCRQGRRNELDVSATIFRDFPSEEIILLCTTEENMDYYSIDLKNRECLVVCVTMYICLGNSPLSFLSPFFPTVCRNWKVFPYTVLPA